MFTLRDVPNAMRRENWTVGAQLMDRWLMAKGWTMPDRVKTGAQAAPASAIDTQIVTMRWALGFARAAEAHKKLVETWATPRRLQAGTIQLGRQLTRWIGNLSASDVAKPFRFGDLSQRVPLINDSCAINIESIDSPWYGTVDDLYAALGRALFKIAVTGMVVRDRTGWTVTIDEIGTFLRDTYDFNGDQPLGSWGPTGFSRMAVGAAAIEVDWRQSGSIWQRSHSYFTVGNDSFRDYRTMFGHGGDFVLFSDLRRQKLARPIVVRVAV